MPRGPIRYPVSMRVNVSEDLRDQLEALAAEQPMALATYVREVLEDHVERERRRRARERGRSGEGSA